MPPLPLPCYHAASFPHCRVARMIAATRPSGGAGRSGFRVDAGAAGGMSGGRVERGGKRPRKRIVFKSCSTRDCRRVGKAENGKGKNDAFLTRSWFRRRGDWLAMNGAGGGRPTGRSGSEANDCIYVSLCARTSWQSQRGAMLRGTYLANVFRVRMIV